MALRSKAGATAAGGSKLLTPQCCMTPSSKYAVLIGVTSGHRLTRSGDGSSPSRPPGRFRHDAATPRGSVIASGR